MKKVVILIVPVLMMMASCSKTITITGNDLKTDVFYAGGDVRPYTGVCRIYYPGTHNVKEEFHYRKGRMEGSFTSYFAEGGVKRKGNYSNGMLSGTLREWDIEGNLCLKPDM
jgi:antitoxin component YwqK of YwqJK toxin-antitoxin module